MSAPGVTPFESSLTIEEEEVSRGNLITEFRIAVLEGNWDYVVAAYRDDSGYHKIIIHKSRGTALHVAVNEGNVGLVKDLVELILRHEGTGVVSHDSALRSTNERGDTPLHLAASRGFIGMCKCIIGELGEFGERKDLIMIRNNKGETPLFRAVLTCQTKTFLYLFNVSKDLDVPLRNYDGDTILHYAIWREFLDLAILITECFPDLLESRNGNGATPLKILAGRPSAFKSGSSLSWWKQILYYCIFVETRKRNETKEYYRKETEKCIERMKRREEYEKQDEHKVNEESRKEDKKENNSGTAVRFVKRVKLLLKWFVKSGVSAVLLAFKCSGLPRLHDTVKELIIIKWNHTQGKQLLKIFMDNPYDSYLGFTAYESMRIDSGVPTQGEIQTEVDAAITGKNQQENNRTESAAKNEQKETTFAVIVDLVSELQNRIPSLKENLLVVASNDIKYKSGKEDVDTEESTFFAAARNGIVEIVSELLVKIPSVVYETNSHYENVLLVAVKNRQAKIVEVLRNNLDKKPFSNLTWEVDDKENTVLHLAADASNARSWHIAGAAMQMMWDIKWYEYVKELAPTIYHFRTNMDNKTAEQVFEEKHENRVEESSKWMKETAESCSVVAALIAGVSFATSSTVPGGTHDGRPELEGKPAFDTFAIASLIGLCFSVTALIMFLAILTSRKQTQDFRKSLPLKLLLGLSSLFISIASMLVSFCAAHFFLFDEKYTKILFPLYIATCLPVSFYAVVQFPLYADLLRVILMEVPE